MNREKIKNKLSFLLFCLRQILNLRKDDVEFVNEGKEISNRLIKNKIKEGCKDT